MFSSTAYEAFYTYIGIYLHESSIQIITSQQVLLATMMLIIGYCFISGVWRYTSRFIPGFGRGRGGGFGFIVRILACFLLAITLLRASTQQNVKNFERRSWHDNGYVVSRLPAVSDSYQVSFLFDLLVRSAEEIAKFANEVADHLFARTNSEIEAPSAFYRAILFAGSQTIDDPELRDKIDVYTRDCFGKILPMLSEAKKTNKIDEFFADYGIVDRELEVIPIEIGENRKISCLDLKTEVRQGLWAFSQQKGARFTKYYGGKVTFSDREYTDEYQRNLIASNALVNHYLSKTEDSLGTQEGAKIEGTLAKFIMGWNRFWSFDGFLNLIGQRDQVGAALTAQRAEKFSEYLQRAPHLKGLVKMFLIAVFPWLVFFIVAGRWKVLIAWYVTYCSVLLWTPIWTLLYHLMTSIAISTEMMAEFGKISDGISLYSSSFITAKIYQFYAIYSWLQLILGPLPTVILGYSLFSSFIKDSEPEAAPSVVTAAKDVGVGAATGGTSGAVGAAIKRV